MFTMASHPAYGLLCALLTIILRSSVCRRCWVGLHGLQRHAHLTRARS